MLCVCISVCGINGKMWQSSKIVVCGLVFLELFAVFIKKKKNLVLNWEFKELSIVLTVKLVEKKNRLINLK